MDVVSKPLEAGKLYRKAAGGKHVWNILIKNSVKVLLTDILTHDILKSEYLMSV